MAISCLLAACTSHSRPVRAAETGPVCADPRLVVEGRLEERFLEPVVRLCEELGTIRDLDATARLRIVPARDGIVLEVSLGDGRVAMRRVTSPDRLREVVEALVVLPPLPPPPTLEKQKPVEPPPTAPVMPQRESARSSLGFELELSFMTRLSRAPTYLSAGPVAHAGLRTGPWSVGLQVRWEPTQGLTGTTPPGFEMDAVGIGFSVARRLVVADGFALDAGSVVTLLNETQSAESGQDEKSGTETDVRLGARVRALVGTKPWYFVPSLEAEVSPARVRRELRIDEALPPLPSWSVAAGVGVAWEAP